MAKWEVVLLISLICYAVVAFLPVWREVELGGMAVFGWLMAVLMVVAPVAALLVFRASDRHSAAGPDESPAGDS